MTNLREVLEKKTRKELAYLLGLAFYQQKKRLGEWYTDKSHIKEVADKAYKGKLYQAKTESEMIEKILMKGDRSTYNITIFLQKDSGTRMFNKKGIKV